MDLKRIIFDVYTSHAKYNPSATDRHMNRLRTYMKKTFTNIKVSFIASQNIEELIELNGRVIDLSFNIEKIYHILSSEQIEEYEIYAESVKNNISKKIDDILYYTFDQL